MFRCGGRVNQTHRTKLHFGRTLIHSVGQTITSISLASDRMFGGFLPASDRMSGGFLPVFHTMSGGFLPASDILANGSDDVRVRPMFQCLPWHSCFKTDVFFSNKKCDKQFSRFVKRYLLPLVWQLSQAADLVPRSASLENLLPKPREKKLYLQGHKTCHL